MYIRCDNCGWSQDDYWEFGKYNPLNFLMTGRPVEQLLLEGESLDDILHREQNKIWTRRDIIIGDLKHAIKKIEVMVYRTQEECNKADRVCPKCGKKQLMED